MRAFYSLFLYLLIPVFILRLFWRSMKAPAYRARLFERFGFVPLAIKSASTKDARIIWLHSVSVGETIAAKPLVQQLLQQSPDHRVLMTTTTPTGSAQVLSLFAAELQVGRLQHCYMPYDLPDAIHRFLNSVRPHLAIFMETEVWPNTLAICHQKKINTLLVNARLSEKSLRGYQRVNALSREAFSRFDGIAAQTQADADRLSTLGGKNISVTGSIKLDISIDESLRQHAQVLRKQWSHNGRRKIIIAASTHAGEDDIILEAYKKLLKTYTSLLLVLVPRHPERFGDAKKRCSQFGLTYVSRSENSNNLDKVQVIVGDSMGEMMLLYGVADIAIVCGSFIPHGGHNMLEPAVWGLPILSGPSVYNFAKIAADMQQRQALCFVEDQQQLLETLQQLMADDHLSLTMGLQAKKYIADNQGALQKVLLLISETLAN